MLSIEHDHELFQFLCFSPQQQDMPPQGGLVTLLPKAEPSQPKSGRKRKSSIACGDIVQDSESPEDYEKRIIHRDVERKRRQEMAGLYKSLRSKVPDEYVQKKRSISDHMHGTVDYIKHLKRKVDELMNKRDELQNLMNLGCSTSSCNGSEFSFNHDKTSVTVHSNTTGVQVILKTSSIKGLPLSKFLRALNGEGMAVVNCISTRANEGQIHVIESEMNEGRSIDQTKLQKRLRDLLCDL